VQIINVATLADGWRGGALWLLQSIAIHGKRSNRHYYY
jgi:hypothetical protein